MQIVPLNSDVLSLFSEVLQLNKGVPKAPDWALSNEMQKIFHQTYDEISLIKIQENGEKIVVASSLPEHLGKNYNDNITITPDKTLLASFKRGETSDEMFTVMQLNLFDPKTQDLQGIIYYI